MLPSILFSYPFYYLNSLLFNTLLLAFYVVLLIQPHDQCLLKSGIDMTAQYKKIYLMGVLILIVDTTISNLLAIYVRFKT